MLTTSSPAQLTTVAGTDAMSSSLGTVATMSSTCSKLYDVGASVCTGTAMPPIIISRWMAAQPPSSPYGTLSRAMVVGRLNRFAAYCAIASAPILLIEYVDMNVNTAWLSPSG